MSSAATSRQKMTIGYLLDDTLDRADGVQQAVLAIGETMRSRGHDIHYIVADTERDDIANVHSVGSLFAAKFNGNSTRTPLRMKTSAVATLFANTSFDVLHVQMPYSPLLSARVLRYAPAHTARFGTFHILPYGRLSKIGTRLLGTILRRTNQEFDKAYAVSGPALSFMQDDFGVMGTVLGNPVDYVYFHAYAGQHQPAKKRIVFVGRFEERKGVLQLLDAYAGMKHRDEVELVMCGKGPLWQAVKDRANERGIPVTLPGFVTEEEKATYLSSATVAAFPSTGGESFGIVLTEAMSAGAGVTIAGNNLGYASVLGEWPNALFDPNDSAHFAQLLDAFITDGVLRATVGTAQHEYVKQFAVQRICDELEADYARSCASRKKGA